MRLTYRVRPWQLAIALYALAAPTPADASWFSTLEVRRSALEAPLEVVVVTDHIPAGVSANDLVAAVRHATQTWNEVVCSRAELTYAGTVAQVDDVAPGQTAVMFVSPPETNCFPRLHDLGFTLAAPCCDQNLVDGACDGTVLPTTTVLLNADDYAWSREPAPYQRVEEGVPLTVDLASVVTHELGHALGLHHDEIDPLATMRARYLLDGGLATLAARDKAALCALYPRDVDECETTADCPPLESCELVDDFRVCEEFRGAVGSYCALDELVCPGFCYLSSPDTYSGYCSTSCDADDDCPGGYVCATDELGAACTLDPLAVGARTGCATGGAHGPASWLALLACLLFTCRRRRR